MNRKNLPKWTEPFTIKEIKHIKEWLCGGQLSKQHMIKSLELNKRARIVGKAVICFECNSIERKFREKV